MRYVWILSCLVGLLSACAQPKLDAEHPYERHLALVNLGGGSALVAVADRALADPDWRVAATACTSAIASDTKALAPVIARRLRAGGASDHRLEYLLRAIGQLGDKTHAPVVRRYLKHSRPSVRGEAILALSPERLGGASTVSWLIPLTQDPNRQVRDRALSILPKFQSRRARLVVALRRGQIDALAELGATKALLDLLKAAKAPRRLAILEIVVQGRKANTPLMLAILEDQALEALHGEAMRQLTRRAPKPVVQSAKRRLQQRWRDRIRPELKRCGTSDWYGGFVQIKHWLGQLNVDALRPTLGAALQACRNAAVGVVRNEVDDLDNRR